MAGKPVVRRDQVADAPGQGGGRKSSATKPSVAPPPVVEELSTQSDKKIVYKAPFDQPKPTAVRLTNNKEQAVGWEVRVDGANIDAEPKFGWLLDDETVTVTWKPFQHPPTATNHSITIMWATAEGMERNSFLALWKDPLWRNHHYMAHGQMRKNLPIEYNL